MEDFHLNKNDSPEINLHEEKNSLQKNEEVKHEFIEHFLEHGYVKSNALSLIPPEDDKTVTFVGSSINKFKSFLRTHSFPEQPHVIYQPCIRTQDFKNAYDLENIPFGMPFFHICGTFSGPGTYKKTSEDVLSFLMDNQNIKADKLCIKPTLPENTLLLDPFYSKVQTSIDPNKHYEWKYGISGIHGYGITIYLQNTSTQEWLDIGNIVTIRNENNQEIAVESGIGLEFFITAQQGFSDPFEATIMYYIEPPQNQLHKKVLTYFQVTLEMLAACENVKGNTRSSKLTRKYINNLNFLRTVHGYSIDDIQRIGNAYYNLTNQNNEIQFLIENLKQREVLILSLHDIIKNLKNNSKFFSKKRFRENFINFCKKNGIHDNEAKLFLKKYYTNDNELYNIIYT